jgi:hypothetical protein
LISNSLFLFLSDVGLAKMLVVALKQLHSFFLYVDFLMKHLLCSLVLAALVWVGTAPTQAQTPVLECAGTAQTANPELRTALIKKAAKQNINSPQSLTCNPPYYLRVNVHFMLNADGTGNFNENDDAGSADAKHWNIAGQWMDPAYNPAGNAPTGYPLPSLAAEPDYNGYKYAEDLINSANDKWSVNPQMDLPVGNTTGHPDKNIRLVLNGVYFHRDDNVSGYDPEDYNASSPNSVPSTAQYDAYGVNQGSEVNIFIMGEIRSTTIFPTVGRWKNISGVAGSFGFYGGPYGGSIWFKAGNIWRNHLLTRARNNGVDTDSQEAVARMLNHEVGHLLGLGHPFQNAWNIDGPRCADTPQNSDPAAGNNMMDYGGQIALTPCQVTTMLNHLTTYYTNYYTCLGCMPCNAFFALPDRIAIGPSSNDPYLDGRASVGETSYSYSLTEVDYNNQPIGPTATESGTGQMGSVRLLKVRSFFFNLNKRYAVTLTVSNSCNTSTMTKYITAVQAIQTRVAAKNSTHEADELTQLYPNPTTSSNFTLLSPAQPLELPTVRDGQGQLVSVEQIAQQHNGTGWHTTYRFGQRQPKSGLYLVELITDGKRTIRQLAIQSE